MDTTVCSFDQCGRPAVALGLCGSHRRHQLAGRPLRPIRARGTCSVSGCDKPHKARGLCRKHRIEEIKRQPCAIAGCANHRHGGLLLCSRHYHEKRGLIRKHKWWRPMSEVFWDFVQRTDTCWLWTGARTPFGHGYRGGKGNSVLAHRYSWELHNGPIPEGMVVRHQCDNPPCVRPDHLAIGTHADNVHDMDERGRRHVHRGQEHYMARVTEADVQDIRARLQDGTAVKDLAAIYGVRPTTIYDIKLRRSWGHV